MKVHPTTLPGCLLLEPTLFNDLRGRFVKTFHNTTFESLGIAADFREEYYSVSKKGVIRGMHFQLPPEDHYKLVYCTAGAIFDAVLDLRRGSPTFGKHESFELSAENGHMLYIPSGFAHGFCALEDNSVMMYRVSTEYSQPHDCGIRWDTVEVNWPADAPIMSERDQSFCSLAEFNSPFEFSES